MPRTNRIIISPEQGAYHIISRTTRKNIMFDHLEKEYLLSLLTTFASAFFITLHAFCIMGNHFHILASSRPQEAREASKQELLRRYKLMYGPKAKPPTGSTKTYGYFQADEDGGIQRLRVRLGSISRFVQEFKQRFSVWYNKKHDLHGYLWDDRFKGIIIERGNPQLVCSIYIDLNPLRAGLVSKPEDYRWSSLGQRVREGKFADQWLSHCERDLACYRELVYALGSVEREGKAKIAEELATEVLRKQGELGMGESLGYRIRNFSEGVAIGSYSFIAEIQKRCNRKFIRPRPFMKTNILFATRRLH